MRTAKNKSRSPQRDRRRAPTISDVARAAGVSTMTVSRVINRTGNVKEATLAAVNAAISSLDYAPNPAARSLAGARQVRVGLLYSNPSAAYLCELLVGAVEEAGRCHVQLCIEKCPPGAGGLEIARQLVARGIDGLLLPPPMCDSQALIDYLARVSIPCVAIASGVPSKRVASVGIDDFAAAQTMTLHLLELGHTRIGFISGNPEQSASARRQQGYEQALQARGIRPAPELIEPGLYTYRSGLDAAEKLLRLPAPPTAIFASNDDMAAAAVAVAHSQGLAVPSDLTVCGFDDTLMATTIWPELTTVRQPIDQMSRAALAMLVDAVRALRSGKLAALRRECLEYTLVRRHSDAAPRRRPPAVQLRQA